MLKQICAIFFIFGQEYADWSFQTDVQTTNLLWCHNMFMESILLIKNIRFIWWIDYIFECTFYCLALQLLNKNTFHGNKTLRLFSVSSEKKKKSSVLFGNSYFYNDCVIKGSQIKLFKDMALTWGLQISIKLNIFTEISY